MPHIRLVGLLLFITAVVLGLVSAATQTTHIRFSQPPIQGSGDDAGAAGQPVGYPPSEPPFPPDANMGSPESEAGYKSIPVAWPLLGLSGVGLLLWFLQPPPPRQGKTRKRSGGHHRRRR
ncbi:MAG: hypothetical protein ACTHOU_12425 [Aureliella sp.]